MELPLAQHHLVVPAAGGDHRVAVLGGRHRHVQEVRRVAVQALRQRGVELAAVGDAPRLPAEVLRKTAEKYREAQTMLLGK